MVYNIREHLLTIQGSMTKIFADGAVSLAGFSEGSGDDSIERGGEALEIYGL